VPLKKAPLVKSRLSERVGPPSESFTAGGLKPALLLRSCFRYFSLSLQSALHVSIALLVLHRSGRVYRCPHRDTPAIQATIRSSPTQEEAAKDGKSPRPSPKEREIPVRVFQDSLKPPERFFKPLSRQILWVSANGKYRVSSPSLVHPTPAKSSAWEDAHDPEKGFSSPRTRDLPQGGNRDIAGE